MHPLVDLRYGDPGHLRTERQFDDRDAVVLRVAGDADEAGHLVGGAERALGDDLGLEGSSR